MLRTIIALWQYMCFTQTNPINLATELRGTLLQYEHMLVILSS